MILVVMFQPLWLCILCVNFTEDVSHCEAPDARSLRFYIIGDQAVVVPQQLGNLRMNGSIARGSPVLVGLWLQAGFE